MKARFLLLLALLALVTNTADAQWRWPEKSENLQVLPAHTDAQTLSQTMRGFVRALGVRCSYCHVGEEGQPLSTYDFVSDEKPAKEAARVMLRMTRAINTEHLNTLVEPIRSNVEVTCITCHRGATKPRMLQEILTETLAAKGLSAALAQYDQLREAYYGGFAYDFSERTLRNLAETLAATDQLEAAEAFLALNISHYPTSGLSYFMLGELHVAQGNTEAAIENLEKSLEIFPDNPRARQRLDALKGNE